MCGDLAPQKRELDRLSDDELVDKFEAACERGNEMDCRREVAGYRAEVLRRLARTAATPPTLINDPWA